MFKLACGKQLNCIVIAISWLALLPQHSFATDYFWRVGNAFYENAAAWLPRQIPAGPDAKVVFDLAAPQAVGLLSDHAVGDLIVTNGADVNLSPGGGNPADRNLMISRTGVIDGGQLRLESPLNASDVNLHISESFTVNGDLLVRNGAGVSSGDSKIGTGVDSEVRIEAGDLATGSSTWDVDGTMVVGESSAGKLVITNGAVVNSRLGSVGRAADPSIESEVGVYGYFRGIGPATWNSEVVSVGAGGAAKVVVVGGGRINSDTALIGNSGNANVFLFGASGSSPGSSWYSQTMSLGDQGEATLLASAGAHLDVEDLIIARTADSVGLLRLSSDGDSKPSTLDASLVSVGGYQQNGGRATVELNTNTTARIGTMNVWPEGLVTLDGGMLTAERIDVTPGGGFIFRDGLLSVQEFEGNLLQFGGTIAPGPRVATTHILGNFTQLSDTSMEVDLGGADDGSFDRFGIDGNAALDGELILNLIRGYTPETSDQLSILSADNILGRFDNVSSGERMITSDEAGSFSVHYGFGSAFAANELVLADYQPTRCGDFDLDGDVDSSDRTVQFQNWTGALPFDEGTRSFQEGDCDGDGDIDTADRTGLNQNWTGAQLAGGLGAHRSIVEQATSLAAADGVSLGASLGDIPLPTLGDTPHSQASPAAILFHLGDRKVADGISATSVVPEPSGFALLLAGVAVLFLRPGRTT